MTIPDARDRRKSAVNAAQQNAGALTAVYAQAISWTRRWQAA